MVHRPDLALLSHGRFDVGSVRMAVLISMIPCRSTIDA